MSTTRSGTVYNKTTTTVTASKRVRPTFFSPMKTRSSDFASTYPKRSNRTAFTEELIRDFCNESDNDSTSNYSSEDEVEEKPLFEVNIDFDEASAAWRSNKRRCGESWVYKNTRQSKRQTDAVVVENDNSVASRVKQRRLAM